MSKNKSPDNDIDISVLLSDLKKAFISELPDRLSSMEENILAMENDSAFTENYENLYRKAHSLKGLAGTYGFNIITSICHSLEDSLNEVGNNNATFSEYGANYWLNYIDLMRDISNELDNGINLAEYEERLKVLQSIQPGGDSCQLHCLVVTNSNLYESLFPSYMANENIKFSFSHDGYAALGRLLTEEFDLVISDYELSLMNGVALFGALRMADCKNSNVKTMLLTSKTKGSDDWVTKPDYVVYKDEAFSTNLASSIKNIINSSK